jgi:cyclic pyranopterin phosphate synthase
MGLPVLQDSQHRQITYLRVSLTDRCNYRCTYCMPEAGNEPSAQEDLLSLDELDRLVSLFVRRGVRRVRLTGGEPTVRKDVLAITERLAKKVKVVMTTNGHRLSELAGPLAAAGLSGINVSVDSLDEARFKKITRNGDLPRVLAGVEAALAAGLPTKINTVALDGFNHDELSALCEWAWRRGAVPRFIEWMPMSEGLLYAPGAVLSAADIRRAIETHAGPLTNDRGPSIDSHGPARYWRTRDGHEVGIISAMTEHFCAACNRVRLTATGRLHTCLGHDDAVALGDMVRRGVDDDRLDAAVDAALAQKRDGHMFRLDGRGGPRLHMVAIGG